MASGVHRQVDHTDKDGRTPLMLACIDGEFQHGCAGEASIVNACCHGSQLLPVDDCSGKESAIAWACPLTTRHAHRPQTHCRGAGGASSTSANCRCAQVASTLAGLCARIDYMFCDRTTFIGRCPVATNEQADVNLHELKGNTALQMAAFYCGDPRLMYVRACFIVTTPILHFDVALVVGAS